MAYTQTLAGFIPEIWAQEMLKFWDEKFVAKNVVSTKYEGTISKKGDVVHIPSIGRITIGDYDNTATMSYENIDDNDASLTIDQRKKYSFKLDDESEAQSAVEVRSKAIKRANTGLMRAAEQFIFGASVVGEYDDVATNRPLTAINATGVVHQIIDATSTPADWAANTAMTLKDRRAPTTDNGYVYEVTTAGTTHATTEPTWPTTIGSTVTDGTAVWTCAGFLGLSKTPAKMSASNVYKYFNAARRMLSESHATAWEDGNMVAVVPPAIIELINTSSELTHATNKGDEVLAKGFAFELAGFNVYESVNVTGVGSDTDPFNCFFGHNECICFAKGFTEGPEALRLEGSFATGVRGLMLYGATVPQDNQYAGLRMEIEI